ncbi:hypothetical protein ABVK25_010713 [Lepraria finkii]|uniref:Antifreeze protein n=1 Tax=Lepraria finkii TaxID=1340010 RepID=A0ABR4ATK7_9LECA
MISVTLILLSLAAVSTTQSSIVSLFLNGNFLELGPASSLVGSIAGSVGELTFECASTATAAASTHAVTYQEYQSSADAAATTDVGIPLSPPGGAQYEPIENPDCPFPTPFTVVQGSSTVHRGYDFSGSSDNFNTVAADCALEGTTSAERTLSASDSLFSDHVTSTTYTGTDVLYDTVLIAAGAATAISTSSKGSLALGKKGSITGNIGPTGTVTTKTGTSTSAKT